MGPPKASECQPETFKRPCLSGTSRASLGLLWACDDLSRVSKSSLRPDYIEHLVMAMNPIALIAFMIVKVSNQSEVLFSLDRDIEQLLSFLAGSMLFMKNKKTKSHFFIVVETVTSINFF